MKLSSLSILTQEGLQRFCLDVHGDELMLDAIGSLPEHWSWALMQLKLAPDKPEWFPKGKWATIQIIEHELNLEAEALLKAAGIEVKL